VLNASALADDWAHWRGPEHTGISRERGLVDDWSLEPPKNVRWVSNIGGRATPVVLNGRVYLNTRTAHDFNDPDEKIHLREQVVCWDAETGDVLWRDEFNVFQTDIPSPRIGWASMCGDPETNQVYVHSVSGILKCYSADGQVVWERSLAEEFGKISGYGGRTQTPIIDEDRLIVSFLAANWGDTKGPGPKHYYYAFDKRNGDLLWVSAPGGNPSDTTYSNPLVTVINGQRLLIAGNADGAVYAMQARTGKKVWGCHVSLRGLNSTITVDGNRVFVAHGEDNPDSEEFGRVACIDATGQGDVTATHVVWRLDGIKAGYTSLLVKDGILYFGTDTGKLVAFDAETGTQLWEQNLGTIGKSGPVWADGKIYVTEVNGNVYILRPSREKCEVLSHVELRATEIDGTDEIYASPAIANGRIYFVTRDRTICVGADEYPAAADPIPPLADEAPASDTPALVQLRPYEVHLMAGQTADFRLVAFDQNGRQIGEYEPELVADAGLADLQIDGGRVVGGKADHDQAGTIHAQLGDLTATARVIVYNGQPEWRWDFNNLSEQQVPPSWIRAFGKLKPQELDGEKVVALTAMGEERGRPSHPVIMGPPSMSGYIVEADVRTSEQRRQLANLGITVSRYTLSIKGNNGKLAVHDWPPHLRFAPETDFPVEPDTWYRLKLSVTCEGGQARVRGKAWPRDAEEPAAWMIDAVDPHGMCHGSPGLYVYALAECYFDNVVVRQATPDAATGPAAASR
jgi:outer membrane protein assembly factor BamB